ncbi:unnamed protein product [Haemonchus placei]|uniref:MFS domain-containing protein n=1 Tax=Haemonchus placei TaxID=6290 RepID=A0A0N4WIN4_HAEPC|nr:unnamed protein product [Haemonchus placei]
MQKVTLCSTTGVRLFIFGWVLTTITNFPSAFTHTSINAAVLKMDKYLNESYTDRYRPLDHHEVSLIKSGINSVWYAGQVAGALMSPYVCDNWGRKPAYLISVVVMTAACGMQMIASLTPFPEILIAGRIITAIFSPLSDAALILYLQEISPSSLRGTMSSLFSTGYAVMCLFGVLLGHEDVLGYSLSVLLFVPVIPGVLSTLALILMPDTPKFLMIKRLTLSFRHYSVTSTVLIIQKFQARRDGCNELSQVLSGTSLQAILTTRHLRGAFAVSVAVLILTLPFYPILQNSTYFFIHLDVPKWLSSSLLMVLLTCSCITSTCIVDKLPRRLLLTAGSSCMISLTIFVTAAEFGFKYIAMAAVFAFISSYGIGVGPVAWFISPEMVPIQYRSAMFCLCYAVHSVLVVLTNFATVPLIGVIGAVCFVPIFIIPCSMALTYIYIFLPETKGREIIDIVNELKGFTKNTDVVTA